MSKNISRAVYDIIAFNLALLILLGVYFDLPVKILLYFSAVLYTPLILVLLVSRRPREFFPENILTFPMVLFFWAIELSVIFSVDYYQSQKIFFSRFLGYFLAFFLGAAAARDRRTKRFLPLVFIAGSLVIAAGGVGDYFRLDPGRLFTSFGAEIHWPVMAGLYVPFLASLALFSSGRLLKITGMIGLGPIFFCMLFHAARVVWIGILAVVIMMAGLKNRKIAFGLVLLTILVFAVSPARIQNRIRTALRLHVKMNMNYTALQIFEDFPVTGAGLATFEGLKEIYDPNSNRDYIHTDNTYTEIMAENGLLGLMAFIWIFVVFFREAMAVIRHQKEEKNIDPVMLGLTGGILAITIINFGTNAVTVGFDNAVIFWVVLGYASTLVSRARRESN